MLHRYACCVSGNIGYAEVYGLAKLSYAWRDFGDRLYKWIGKRASGLWDPGDQLGSPSWYRATRAKVQHELTPSGAAPHAKFVAADHFGVTPCNSPAGDKISLEIKLIS
ncbi:hypothetical protein TELCIR_02495 [Teladorsagia circumcincta]|uniref:Uncharacterized protein n=1 Tax=Teladorsagia circumcincta TaxID=45464 RepID=A0A2G9UZ91_TELCI|nr:hypothetical protein TELCIR_02495 [Teladorsagia circumcincta]